MTVGIPDLPETTSPNNTDELLLNNNGNPRRVKVERVLALTGLDANEIETRISQNEIDISSLETTLENITTDNLNLSDLPGTLSSSQINDGPGSGLNADLLDGIQATGFATSSQGQLADSALQPEDLNPGSTLGDSLRNASNLTSGTLNLARLPSQVWRSDNDGPNSGLDADLLDGQQGSYYLNASNLTGTVPLARLPTGSGSGLDADLLDGQQGSYYLNYNNFTNKPAINDSNITINAGNALSGGGNFTINQSTNKTITINHSDTSTQSSVNNSGSTVIQDVTLDGYGHVTGLGSKTLTASDVGALAVNAKAADSNLLDGINSSNFLRADISQNGSNLTNVDAASLDGIAASNYGVLSQQEDVSSRWLFESGAAAGSVRYNNPANSGDQGSILHQNGYVSTHANSDSSGKFGRGNSGAVVQFYLSGTSSGTQVFMNSNFTVAYQTGSDYRLKENITNLSEIDAITAIQSYQPKKFTWKENQGEDIGFIAHEFAQVSPNYVSNEKDAVDEDGNPIYQGMQAGNSKTIAELVKVCQYLISENEELKNRVEILENS